jgi:hypothetical protein
VLGVDEHTGVVLDLDADTATVLGLGGLTVRAGGRSTVFPTGTTVAIDQLREAAEGGGAAVGGQGGTDREAAVPQATGGAASPLLVEVRRLQDAFDAAMGARDVRAALAAALELDDLIVAWSRDTLQGDETDRARSALRGMVVRLGEAAEVGVADPAERVAPFVLALLSVRDRARAAKDFATSDAVRDDLTAAGVELRDTPEGTSWHLLP